MGITNNRDPGYRFHEYADTESSGQAVFDAQRTDDPGPRMENEYKYRVVAWWTSGRTGIAKSEAAPSAIHFAAPPLFGGLEGRWTPEDLLMTALASCFTTTFHAIAECSKFEYTDLAVEAEGAVSKADNTGYAFSAIVIRPTLTIPHEEQRERAFNLLHKAKTLCLVSRALAIPQEFEARVEIGKHSPV
jgi:peroxiredoxin-like protein